MRRPFLIRRELGNKWGIAFSLNALGKVASAQGDHAGARSLHEEALAMMREMGNRYGVASSLHRLGTVAHNLGEHETAHAMHEQSLAIMRELGDKLSMAVSLIALGGVAAASEQADQGATLLGAAEA